MNVTISYINPNLPEAWKPQVNKDITKVYTSVVAIISAIPVQFLLSQNLGYIRRHLSTFFSTPTKLVTFLYLGQAPLRHFGFLDHFSLTNITGIAGFGGIGLSILYLLHDHYLHDSGTSSLTVAEGCDGHDKEIKLDRALREKVTFLLVCEIYHTVIGVVIGVSAMRVFKFCVIDHKHLDLLITAGLFGPTIFFALFISLAGIVFGITWCLQRFRHWWVMH